MISIPVVVLSILIPVAISLLFAAKQKENKQKWIQVLATAAVSVLSMQVFRMLFGDWWSAYEHLLINAITASVITILIVPALQRKTFSYLQILKLSCMISMLIVSYSILTVGQTMIHGDTATASLLTKAQIAHRSWFPDSWYYVNGEIWLLSMQNFVAPFVLLLKDQSLARMLGSLLVVLVTAWMLYMHSKKAYRDDSWLLALPLMFIFLSGERDMMLYQVAYTPQMMFLVAGIMWMFRVYRKSGSKRDYFCLGILAVLLVAGGMRDLAETVLPLWMTCMLLNYLEVRNRENPDWKAVWKEWFRLTLAVMLPAVIGLAVHLYLKSTLHVVNSAHNSLVLVGSMGDCIDNVLRYIANLFDCFGFDGDAQLVSPSGIWSMCCVVMCGIVVFVVPVLQALKLKQENDYVKFMYTFAVVHNLVMFVLAVFLKGKAESRYLLTTVFAWILVSSRYIYVYWIRQKHFEKYIWTGLFVLASVIGCLSLGVRSTGWDNNLYAREYLPRQLAERGLTKGYGDFWTVCGYEVYSDFQVRFGGLEMYNDDFIMHYWLTDGEVFTPEDTDTFLLLTERENKRYASLIRQKFEEPIDYFTIDDKHIYVFDYDIAEDMG